MKVRVSAPGKSILMGEHAAVYHRPALVAAIDRRTTADLSDQGVAGRIHLDLPQVGVREDVDWGEVLSYTRSCRDGWESYRQNPDPDVFARVRGDDPAHLVKIALGEAALHLGDARPPGVVLRVDSRIPVGSGFGSSAAVAVAVVDAYLALRGAALEPDELHRLTLDVERRQHGLPSGVDNAAVIRGGLVWARKERSGAVTVEPVETRPAVLEGVRLFHSGAPAEPTGTVVAAVRQRRESDPERFEQVLDRMERATEDLRRELEGTAHPPTEPCHPPLIPRGGKSRMIELIRDFESCLEELGVVPEAVRRIVRQVERRGGAAKISGAGALTGTGAGALLVYRAEGAETEEWDFLDAIEALDLGLGAEGVRRESF